MERKCLQKNICPICVIPSPIYSTKKPSIFLIKFYKINTNN
ncbi:hypothetical protein F383_08606 [Gossypium arboreum]|uniref:Uncharacterized protein n=1 Tax=Gossypium arboreum TaxID=29729 RepID=A0A0B0P4W4_GOSAR|nr:hypothetical protein F383_00286 [Gossypium arboreum]KHG28256.1 hypothetical protein F383_08606 [Gossypium arboreum]